MALRKVCTKCRKPQSRCQCDNPTWRYQIDYYDPTGKRIRKDFEKKKDAEAELGKRVSLRAEGRYLDVKKEYKTTDLNVNPKLTRRDNRKLTHPP